MLQQTLKQIDQKLIELIGKRIAVLAESKPPSLEEQLSNLMPLLAQKGVPENIWQNVVISCAATLATMPSSLVNTRPRLVTVIGGRGMMGQFFVKQLSAAGHEVRILEHNDWDHADWLLSGAELVLVCVPVECTLDVIYKAAKYLTPSAALADVTSIKTPILRAMMEHHKGPVLGLHPMFGPNIKSFLSQNVVVCPGRRGEAFQWFLNLIESKGGKLTVCTPEEHDQMMVVIQAIRHFATFGLGILLAEAEIDINRSSGFSSPSYRMELGLISRMFAQHGPLVVDIMLATDERREAISRLATIYGRLAQLVLEKNREALIEEFKVVHSFLAEEIPNGIQTSTYLINALSTLLAANGLERRHLTVTET